MHTNTVHLSELKGGDTINVMVNVDQGSSY